MNHNGGVGGNKDRERESHLPTRLSIPQNNSMQRSGSNGGVNGNGNGMSIQTPIRTTTMGPPLSASNAGNGNGNGGGPPSAIRDLNLVLGLNGGSGGAGSTGNGSFSQGAGVLRMLQYSEGLSNGISVSCCLERCFLWS